MIELQYFQRSDFQQLIDWIDSPQTLLQWGGPAFKYPLTFDQLEDYMKHTNSNNASVLIYKVIDRATSDIVGHISLGQIDKKNKSARVGKVLVGDTNARGKGYGQQMIKAILHIAFDDLDLHRVSLGVFDFNVPAILCYEKAGFIKEGLRRDARKNGDTYWSLWEMSILENEWLDMRNN